MRKDKGLNGDLDRLPMLTWIMFLKFLDDLEGVRQEEAKLAGKRWAAKPDGITGPEPIAFVNPPEELADSILQKEKRIAELMAEIKQALAQTRQ